MIAALACISICLAAQPGSESARLFEEMLASTPTLRGLAAEPERYNLQITIGEIDGAGVTWHEYRPDAEYFYPASTVKLIAAVLTPAELRRLSEAHGVAVSLETPMTFYPLFDDETLESRDESNPDGGVITVGHEIRKLFLASDNRAFNRLYELLGHERLNRSLAELGYPDARFTHRLSEWRTPEGNRMSPRIDFNAEQSDVTVPERTSGWVYPDTPPPPGVELGRAYATSNGIVREPLGFADNNRVRLRTLLEFVAATAAPELGVGPPLDLTEDERAFLIGAMRQLPRESANPVYDPAEYPDEWGKFFLPGLRRELPAERIVVFNKIGRAYGTSTDAALIADTATGRRVLLAVTLYTNDNAVLNDNDYEYESLADPALADIAAFVARRFLAEPDPQPAQP